MNSLQNVLKNTNNVQYPNKINEVFNTTKFKNEFVKGLKKVVGHEDPNMILKVTQIYENHVGTECFFERLESLSQADNIVVFSKHFLSKHIDRINKLASFLFIQEFIFGNIDILGHIIKFLPLHERKHICVSKSIGRLAQRTFKLACCTDVIDLKNFFIINADKAVNFVIKHRILHPNFSGFTDFSNRHLELLSDKCNYLESLTINSSKISDSGLKHLQKLSSISSLSISGAPSVTTKGLGYITQLELKSLTLCETGITDSGLKKINGSNLTSLDLSFTNITSRGLKYLEPMQLTSLALDGCDVAKGLKYLEGKELTKLTLYADKDISLNFKRIGTFSKLTFLKIISQHPIEDSSLQHLQKLPLTHLIFAGDGNTAITDKGMKYIKDMPLRHLELFRADITDKSLRIFQKLPLDHLNIGFTPITDEGLRHLSSMSIRSLSLVACAQITGATFGSFIKTPLTTLNLRYTSIDDNAMENLKNQMSLTHLNLGNTYLTDEGLKKLGKLKLNTLILTNCKINGSGFKDFHQKTLYKLKLKGSMINDNGLYYLRKQPINFLNMTSCQNVIGMGFEAKEFSQMPLVTLLAVHCPILDTKYLKQFKKGVVKVKLD